MIGTMTVGITGSTRCASPGSSPRTAAPASLVLDVPSELRSWFGCRAGPFCAFRATIGGETVLRCYSMSSSPTSTTSWR